MTMTPEQIEALKAEVMTLEHLGGLWVTAEDYIATAAALEAANGVWQANLRLVSELEAVRAERDSFRAVLEGAEYGDIDGIAKYPPEVSRHLGALVGDATKQRIAELEAVRVENAALRAAARIAVNQLAMQSQVWADDLEAALATHEKEQTP